MDNNTEIIFNLFLINFRQDHFNPYPIVDEGHYNCYCGQYWFSMLRDCFPVGEVTKRVINGEYDNIVTMNHIKD